MSAERLRIIAGIGIAAITVSALAYIAIARNDEACKGALIAVLSAASGYIYRGSVVQSPTDTSARRRATDPPTRPTLGGNP